MRRVWDDWGEKIWKNNKKTSQGHLRRHCHLGEALKFIARGRCQRLYECRHWCKGTSAKVHCSLDHLVSMRTSSGSQRHCFRCFRFRQKLLYYIHIIHSHSLSSWTPPNAHNAVPPNSSESLSHSLRPLSTEAMQHVPKAWQLTQFNHLHKHQRCLSTIPTHATVALPPASWRA